MTRSLDCSLLPAVEGWAFAFSRPSAIAVGIAELAALAYFAGVKTPFRVAAGTALAMGTLRTWHCLFTVSRQPACGPAHVDATPYQLHSLSSHHRAVVAGWV